MNGVAHVSVLRDETLAALNVQVDGIYVDATFGRGGHSRAILEALGPDGHLLALDRDPEAVAAARREFGADPRFAVQHGRFSMLKEAVTQRGWLGRVSGVLLDLGVSSPQLDIAGRGFSFREDGPLDMRMDPTQGASAAEWLNTAAEEEISRVLFELGEERYARRIARAIMAARQEQPLATTRQLAEIITRAQPTRERHKDPATRSFQAIRLQVNDELGELRAVLPQALDVLAIGGRMVVISFHSLEDRMVKNFLRDAANPQRYPLDLPVRHEQIAPRLRLLGKAQRAGAAELARNPRARSAVLRAAEVLHAA